MLTVPEVTLHTCYPNLLTSAKAGKGMLKSPQTAAATHFVHDHNERQLGFVQDAEKKKIKHGTSISKSILRQA